MCDFDCRTRGREPDEEPETLRHWPASMPDKPITLLSHLPLALLDPVRDEFGDLDWVEIPGKGELEEGIQGEVLLTLPWGTPNLGHVVERGVRWIHTIGTGVDGFPTEHLEDRILTCARGANSEAIAEWTLAMMLAFEKQLPDMWIDRPPERWNTADLGGLSGKTLGIVGLGSIGQAIAIRALAFGVRVRALRRSDAASPLPGVELAASLRDLLESADHLVIAAPATRETHHLIGAEALAWVRPGVHLVNIARGSLLDQDALRPALEDGRVARASLDVAETEPVPEGHWLYTPPRVRLSAHVSWSTPNAIELLVETFAANLRRYLRGKPLQDQVDFSRGY